MPFNIAFLIFVIGFVICDVQLIHQDTEFILCRTCGNDVSSNNYIFSKLSPNAQYYFNDTLFNVHEVSVQVFTTGVFFHYPVISFLHSTCIAVGEWEESTSWFPGYRWKPCVCPECEAYIGFVFEPINPDLVKPSKTFYGLILTTLIGESFLNSLVVSPSITSD